MLKTIRNVDGLRTTLLDRQSCRQYLFGLRWPDGFLCPRCGQDSVAHRGDAVLCGCGYKATVTAGTIFQDSHLPLTTWFRAMWQVTSQKNGVSALGLQRVLGLGSYKTAWAWLAQAAAGDGPSRSRSVAGRVEVDETYWGGEKGMAGRLTEKKALIMVAAEEDGKGIGRIRMRRVPDALAEPACMGFLPRLEPGSMVRHGWLERLSGVKERLRPRGAASAARRANHLLPRVHRVVSLLKRWLLGTHQGAIGHEYLDYYLDEFTFRFNRRKSRHRGKLFYRLVQQAVQTEPVPYDRLVRVAGKRLLQEHNP